MQRKAGIGGRDDVIDHRQVERELREANERFARIFHNAPIGEAIVAPDGQFLQVNRALCEIVGYPEHELLEKTFQDITHPDDLDADLEFVRQMLAGEIRTYEMEKRYLHKLGHVVWILLNVSLVRDDEGEPISFVSQIQDITERIEAERRLREAELRYRTLVEQLPLAMYIRPLDMADANIYCSPKVQDLLGYTAEEWESDPGILGRTVHPEDVQYAIDNGERVRRTGEPFRGEYRFVHRDGRIVWMQDETYLIRDDAGEPVGVQGFLLDITERKQTETERDRLQDELHHAQKIEAIGQLAGGVAHEFNNTLTAITAYSSLMLARLQPDSPLRHDVEQVIGSAERAATLTRQLLAFGRKQVLQPRAIDLNEIVRTSIELLQPLVHPGIRLETSLDETVPVTEADPAQIEQVIVNLVLNARDAIEDEGTITIGTRLVAVDDTSAEQHDVEPGEFLELRVDDTGCGMDEETRSRIFEPFFTTKEEGKGTGLGLSTAYGIVRQGGGFVTVETEPGDGTTMTVLLPLRTAQAHAAVDATPRRPVALEGTALVVDDDEAVREVCADLLERMGYVVRTARDGLEALELLGAGGSGVDLLLTDVVMPGLGGVELGRRAAAHHPRTTVVFMSGFPGDLTEAGEELLFLQKPFTADDLESLVAPQARQGIAGEA